jgi:stage II sporulation protein D
VALGEVAEIEVEEYLKGVVCGEMEGFPNSPEALKAQAIASRTYALYRAKHNENGYDLDDTTKCQVLLASRMAPAYDEAVEGTRGDIVIYKGRIIDAVYSASNGGRVVSAQERWGETIPYLIAKPDPYNAQRMGLGRQGHGVGMSQWGAY